MTCERVMGWLLVACCTLAAPWSHAQFPERAVRLIVPAGPGGTADILARLLGQELSQAWRRPVVVENRPGAAGVVGAQALASAPPDGHTLALLASNHAINPVVTKALPYDTFKDFAPVARIAAGPGLLVVNPAQIDARDVQGAMEAARRQPGRMNFASPVPLTAGHRSMELLKRAAGVDIVHVPYKSGADAVNALLGGQVQFLIIAVPSVIGQVEAGRLRALAVTSRERFATLPSVPTLAESGFADFDSVEWYGVFAPAGVPAALIQRIAADVQKLTAQPRIQERLLSMGLNALPGGPVELGRHVEAEHTRWARLAPLVGLKAD